MIHLIYFIVPSSIRFLLQLSVPFLDGV